MAEIAGSELGAASLQQMEGSNASSYVQYSSSAAYNAPTNLVSVNGIPPMGIESGIGTAMESSYQSMAYSDQIDTSMGGGAIYDAGAYGMGVSGAYDASYAAGMAGGSAIGMGVAEDIGLAGYSGYDASGYGISTAYGAEYGAAGAIGAAGGISAGAVGLGAGAGGVALPLSSYKIQVDPNPTIIRKQLSGAAAQYRQNIMIRFLKPPAPPAPGPLIIKEIRPPQPRPAPPLIIRQRPPRPRTPPPLILRERPPRMPRAIKTQVIVKRLAALPPPPRQVIIERYPPLPPKPRDIIIERWLQYGPLPKRRVIYQRAARARAYRTAKNVIIQYTSPRPQLQRVFQRLGIVDMNPIAYVNTYGASLLDSASLVTAARTAGVIENITPPALVYSTGIPLGGAAIGGAAVSAYESGMAAAGISGIEALGEGGAFTEAYGAGGFSEYGYGGAGYTSAAEALGTESSGLISFGGMNADLEGLGGASQYDYASSVTGGAAMSASYEESGLKEMQIGGSEIQTEVVGGAAEGMSTFESSSYSETVS